jgi:hypothetical protein
MRRWPISLDYDRLATAHPDKLNTRKLAEWIKRDVRTYLRAREKASCSVRSTVS